MRKGYCTLSVRYSLDTATSETKNLGFDKEIELAKLQAKIASQQTDTYTMLGTCISIAFASLVVAYTQPSPVGPIFFGIAFLLGATCGVIVRHWRRYQSGFRDDFNKISRGEKIEF